MPLPIVYQPARQDVYAVEGGPQPSLLLTLDVGGVPGDPDLLSSVITDPFGTLYQWLIGDLGGGVASVDLPVLIEGRYDHYIEYDGQQVIAGRIRVYPTGTPAPDNTTNQLTVALDTGTRIVNLTLIGAGPPGGPGPAGDLGPTGLTGLQGPQPPLSTDTEAFAAALTTKAITPANWAYINSPLIPKISHLASGADNYVEMMATIEECAGGGNPVAITRTCGRGVEPRAGVYDVATKIDVRSVIGFEMYPKGYFELRPTTDMTAVIDINGSLRSKIGNINIQGTAGVQVDNGILLRHTIAEAARSTSANELYDIWIRSDLDYVAAVRIGGPADGSAQVDNTKLDNINIAGGWTAGEASRWQYGLVLGNGVFSNNLNHHCTKINSGANRYNLYVDATTCTFSGDFSSGEIDVYLNTTGYCELAGIRSEGSQRFLKTAGPSAAPTSIDIHDIAWRANGMNADGEWIYLLQAGYYGFKALKINSPNVCPILHVNTAGTPAHVEIDGFVVVATAGYPTPVLSDMIDLDSPTAHSIHVNSFVATNSAGSTQRTEEWCGPNNAQTGTAYTFTWNDHTRLNTFSNASAITVTVPPNSTMPVSIGHKIELAQMGAGQVTVAPGAGVTVNPAGTRKLIGQYSTATLRKTGTDTWLLSGDITA